jgi:hypothetical protein
MIKARWVRWAGYVARMGKKKMLAGFWCGNVKERDLLEDLDVGVIQYYNGR